MSMSVENVLETKIPEGKYFRVLCDMQKDVFDYYSFNKKYPGIDNGTKELLESLCDAFEVLVNEDNVVFNSYQAGYEKGKEHERLHTLSEVRRVVEEMIGECEPVGAPTWASSTLRQFLRRLSELEAKG